MTLPIEGPGQLPELLARLAREEWSGAVDVAGDDGVSRSLYLVEGRLSTATSSDAGESLIARLVEAGTLAANDVELAIADLKSADRGYFLGRQLARLGLLTDSALARAERRRVLAMAQAALATRAGRHASRPGAVVGEALPPQAIEMARVVATTILTCWEGRTALDALGGAEAVLRVDFGKLAEYEATDAEEEYDLALLRVDGRRTVRAVVDAVELPADVTLRFLAACRVLGCLEPVPAGAVRPPAAAPSTLRPAASGGSGVASPGPAPEVAARAPEAASERPAPASRATRPPGAAVPPDQPAPSRLPRWLAWILLMILLAAAAVLGHQTFRPHAPPAGSAGEPVRPAPPAESIAP